MRALARPLAMVLLLIGGLLLVSAPWVEAQGSVYVRPYVRSDGAYVPGHYRSAPDGNPYNNWSTQGNVNPYTGQLGTVDPYRTPFSSYGTSNPFLAPRQHCIPTYFKSC
jgi:hypothetical protein